MIKHVFKKMHNVRTEISKVSKLDFDSGAGASPNKFTINQMNSHTDNLWPSVEAEGPGPPFPRGNPALPRLLQWSYSLALLK